MAQGPGWRRPSACWRGPAPPVRGPCPEQMASPTPAVHPVVMVQAPSASLQADHVTIVPDLPAHDPLLHHMALVLQAAVTAEGVADRLYAEILADALAVHVLKPYAAPRPVLPEATGGPPACHARIGRGVPAHGPLPHHMALVLQAAVAAEGVADRLYAEILADALAVHVLKRYAASRPVLPEATGGLAPYKLRRTIAYIQDH